MAKAYFMYKVYAQILQGSAFSVNLLLRASNFVEKNKVGRFNEKFI